MTVMLEIPDEVQADFMTAAEARGVPLSDYLRDFILEHYQEDSEGLFVAQERLADPKPGITSSQLRKSLGLDD